MKKENNVPKELSKSKWWQSPLFYSLLSVALLSLPWLVGLSFLSLVGWVPLLLLREKLQREGRRGFLWWVTLTIMLWHIATCFWVSFATVFAAPAVPIVCWSMLWWGWVAYHRVAKFASKALSYTVLVTGWVVGEWWLASGDFGFGWLQLGSAWATQPFMVQWYKLFGVFGGTLWVMLCNVLIYEVLSTRQTLRRALREKVADITSYSKKLRGVKIRAAVVVVLPVLLSCAMYFTEDVEEGDKIQVAVIQPNVDAYQKFKSGTAAQQIQNMIALASQADTSTLLYVAPETAIASRVDLRTIDSHPQVASIQRFLSGCPKGALFIIGASTSDGKDFYNSVLYIHSDRVAVYHKRKLVYGVEVVHKWVESLAGMIDLGGYVGSLGRSTESLVAEAGDAPVGAVVCYESIYGELMSEWVMDGAQLLAVITNDGWWGDTPGYRQHFSYARLRAVENGRWIVRSANTGISGIINSRGDVIESMGWDKEGIIIASVPLKKDITPYTAWGDIVLRISALVLALSLLFSVSLWYRNKANG
ncbi:MAG: apolipoprotein N-acyltransferase [Rikenellaceae bacterium]